MKAAVLAAVALVAAGSTHVVETATSASVQAQLSYDYDTQNYAFSNVNLTISHSGTVVLNSPVRPLSSYAETDPAWFGVHKSVAVRNLDPGSEPEVLVDLYSGGAHCCWYTEAYRYVTSASTYLLKIHSWGNTFYRLRDLDHDGLPEFVSSDDRFAYVFTSFAGSTFPVQIW